MEIQPVILCGGSGTRLWPLSRGSYPKQFLALNGESSLLQQTVGRLDSLGAVQPLLVTNSEHRFLVAEQMRETGTEPTAIVLEPVRRNTAPAVAAAALLALRRRRENALLLVLPADHVIADTVAFTQAVTAGRVAAEAGALVTFGIVPGSPETGYGYIRTTGLDGLRPVPIDRFVEKPDRERAQQYLDSGDYLWNSGMFLFSAERYLTELERHAPELLATCKAAVDGAVSDLEFCRLEPESFANSPNISIDYAVMEKTDDGVVIPLDAGWSDVGSWTSLKEIKQPDADGNVTVGDVLLEDATGNYVHAQDRLVASVGLRDHIVVETDDAVFVAPCDRAQDVKRLVDRLQRDGREETFNHRRVFRPWGSYKGVAKDQRYQVKSITVKPGCSLSLQQHHHRAEHWVVVKGTARVVCDDKTFLLTEDQSTYISIGSVHRLENPGVIPLELIEVQTGSYLGEDDIVRLEDQYGRQ